MIRYILEGLVSIPDSGKHHLVHIVDIYKLLSGHILQRGIADRSGYRIISISQERTVGDGLGVTVRE